MAKKTPPSSSVLIEEEIIMTKTGLGQQIKTEQISHFWGEASYAYFSQKVKAKNFV